MTFVFTKDVLIIQNFGLEPEIERTSILTKYIHACVPCNVHRHKRRMSTTAPLPGNNLIRN
jgi:hypothetical protein